MRELARGARSVKTNRLLKSIGVFLLSALCAGCADMIRSWPPGFDFTPSSPGHSSYRPAPSGPPPSEAAPKAVSLPPPKVVTPAPSAGSKGVAREAPPPPAGGEAQQTKQEQAKVTLAGDNAIQHRAEQVLNGAAEKLARVDRGKLSTQGATVYDQASGFVSAARRAIDQQDYPAASGLADKAAVLASKLETSGGQ